MIACQLQWFLNVSHSPIDSQAVLAPVDSDRSASASVPQHICEHCWAGKCQMRTIHDIAWRSWLPLSLLIWAHVTKSISVCIQNLQSNGSYVQGTTSPLTFRKFWSCQTHHFPWPQLQLKLSFFVFLGAGSARWGTSQNWSTSQAMRRNRTKVCWRSQNHFRDHKKHSGSFLVPPQQSDRNYEATSSRTGYGSTEKKNKKLEIMR